MRTHAELSAEPGIAAELPAAAEFVDNEPRFGPFQSLCIWAIAGGALWYVLYQVYRLVGWLFS